MMYFSEEKLLYLCGRADVGDETSLRTDVSDGNGNGNGNYLYTVNPSAKIIKR